MSTEVAPPEGTPPPAPHKQGMPKFVRILMGIGLVLLALFAVITLVGLATPQEHEVTKSLTLQRPVNEVYTTIVDWEHYPEWRKELAGVSKVDDPEGDPRWLEDWEGDQDVELEMTAAEPPQRVEITIHDPSGMFSGTWDFRFVEEGQGTNVSLTEHGRIPNPMVRGMMTCMPGAKGYCLNLFLNGLAKKYGEDAKPG